MGVEGEEELQVPPAPSPPHHPHLGLPPGEEEEGLPEGHPVGADGLYELGVEAGEGPGLPPEAVGEDRRPEALGPQEPLRRPEEVEVCPHEAEGKPP